jgi:alpha-L-arabinofuranosidase
LHGLLIAGFMALVGGTHGAPSNAVVRVNAAKVLLERAQSLVGANIEDLNLQLYGGLYGQLIYGEAFEEQVDPTEIFGLKGSERFAVWVLLDKRGEPFLSLFPGRGPIPKRRQPVSTGPTRSPVLQEKYQVGDLTFKRGVILPEELEPGQREKLLSLAKGDFQTSRHWRKIEAGSVTGRLRLVRSGVFTGKQAQQIEFVAGTGEFGIDNAGVFRWGIPFVAGKPYEGTVRVKCDLAQTVVVSLRNSQGEVLDKMPIEVPPTAGSYRKLEFVLTPKSAAVDGRFAITLQRPGAITVDYAFLQPGDWGRFRGLPVRKEFAEAMLSMGVATARYNGSMVNKCPDGPELYKWKKMIGPRDERPPYEGFFNPYASHGFSVFEWMDFCEAAGIWPLFGLRTDETEQDMADLVDYCLGGGDTAWGKRRIESGHPKPYRLKAVQVGNEEPPSPAYFERARALATAIWSKNRSLDVVLSVNVLRGGGDPEFIRFVRWCREQGQGDRVVLDSHYGSRIDHADTDLAASVGLELHHRLAAAVPGFSLRLWPMEENGDRCTWARGLAHAHNLNTLQRMPAFLERAGTANTFQAWDIPVVWDQGRIHFTSTNLVFQPSYYIDRMFADEWLPVILDAQCDSKVVDVLAKMSHDGKVLALYILNLAEHPVGISFALRGFVPQAVNGLQLTAPALTAKNSPENPALVAPRAVELKWDTRSPMELPPWSFRVIRLSR